MPRWGRWEWGERLGRWHAVAETGWGLAISGTLAAEAIVPAVKTACGEVRTVPPHVTAVPDPPVCPKCEALDALREKCRLDQRLRERLRDVV